jgi:DNA-binding response OmpR family regulator
MKLLLVEDSEDLQKLLALRLREAGYAVDATGRGEEGLWLAESNDYDAIILDIVLPGLDGLTVLQRLRARGRQAHVLLLTGMNSVEDRVRGLQAGADDYLVKPFAIPELMARVQALCRRSYGQKHSHIRIHDLEVDLARRSVKRTGLQIKLQPREYALLEYLALRRGEVVSRHEIEHHIYDEQVDPMSNVVDSAVCVLRKKITPPGSSPLIHTRRGQGYVLELEPA